MTEQEKEIWEKDTDLANMIIHHLRYNMYPPISYDMTGVVIEFVKNWRKGIRPEFVTGELEVSGKKIPFHVTEMRIVDGIKKDIPIRSEDFIQNYHLDFFLEEE